MSIIKFKENGKVNYGLALKKIKEQDYLFAIRLLKDAIKAEANPKYYIELAELYYILKQYKECAAVYVELSHCQLTMDISFALLRANQMAYGLPLDAEQLRVQTAAYFKMSSKSTNNPKLNNIIELYQKQYLKEQNQEESPRLINVKEKRNLDLLDQAKECIAKGDYVHAMIFLDLVDAEYADFVLEIKTVLYCSAGDYEECVKHGLKYNKKHKGNPAVVRTVLYAMFKLKKGKDDAEYRKLYEELALDLLKTGDSNNAIGLYHSSLIMGYSEGAAFIGERLMEYYPYDSNAIITAVSYYALMEEDVMIDKILQRANLIHTNNPTVNFLNALRKDKRGFNVKYWAQGLDATMRDNYTEILLNECLERDPFVLDEDILKAAIGHLSSVDVKSILKNQKLRKDARFLDLLIWGIESPYVGIDTKVALLETYLPLIKNENRVFVIPTEIGVHCALFKNLSVKDDALKEELLTSTYANVYFTRDETDSKLILKIIDEVLPLRDGFDDIGVVNALLYCLYVYKKEDKPKVELVAKMYNVSLNELQRYIDQYKK